MTLKVQTKDEQIIEIPAEKTYLKAEIKEIWTPHIIIAKNVSDMTYYKELIKITFNGKDWIAQGFPWREYIKESNSCDLDYAFDIKYLLLFIDMPYLNKRLLEETYISKDMPDWDYIAETEPLVLISLNDLKDKKPGDIIIQKDYWENDIFPYFAKCILYPNYLLRDFVRDVLERIYKTADSKEFPYLKIYVTLRCAELSFKTIKNEIYYLGEHKGPEFFKKMNEYLNKERNDYIVKYFLTHFKEDDYLKKEFFEKKHILELYKVLESEPIRFYNIGNLQIKPPKDPYRDIQKLKNKIEKDLKDSLIYKAIKSYNLNIN
jgi:hypothetical protein